MGYGELPYGTGTYKYGGSAIVPVQPLSVLVEDDGISDPSTGIDLKINLDTNDLIIADGDLVLCSGTYLIMQTLQTKLLTFYGEWFLDTTFGVKYLSDVLVKSPDLPKIKSLLKDSILNTTGVTKIVSIDFNYDARNRTLDVKFVADTIYGQITQSIAM